MSVSSWVAALRLARRDVTRNRGRSALVVGLIGVPVLLVGVADIGYHTYQLSPAEKVTRQLGAADAGLQWAGARSVGQGADGWLGGVSISAPSSAVPSVRTVEALLPRGSRVIEERVDPHALVFRTRAGLAQSQLVGLDYADPIAAGLVTQRSGRAPRSTREVAITTALARATGLGVGDLVRAQRPSRTFRIVGTVTDTSNQRDRALYSVPAAVSRRAAASATSVGYGSQPGLTWLARTPRPVTWAATRRANRVGLLVLSRSVYLRPVAAARAATRRLESSTGRTAVIATAALVAGMALLEIVLLAGPAFAVGAKRRRRDLALIAAGGGSPRDVRHIVLAGGVVLGSIAGVLGALGAVLVARLGLPLLRPHVARLPGHFDAPPIDLLVLAGSAVLAAVLASVVPARAAARTDVVAALSGRPSPARIRGRVPVLAVALGAVGVLIAVVGSRAGGNTAALAILGGTAVLEIAIIVCTPTVLVLAARSGRRLPLTLRMALRDAGRNRSAATPAVAAVMASVVGATSVLVGLASVADQQRREYQRYQPVLSAITDVPTDGTAARDVARDLAATLPARAAAALDVPAQACTGPSTGCRPLGLAPHGDVTSESVLPTLVIDDGAAAATLFGPRAGRARAALRSGRVVVTVRSQLRGGTVRLDTEQLLHRGERTVTHAVPATYVAADGGPSVTLVVPGAVARRLGARAIPQMAVARLRHAPSDAQRQATLARLQHAVPDPNLYVETGYHDSYAALQLALVLAAVVIAMLAAVIATGLANVDARPELLTLAAVGAAPRIRRALSSARAGTIAAVGSVVGVAAGFLAPAAWVFGSPDEVTALHLVVPWPALVALAVAVPVLAAVVAGVLTRGRLPVE